MGNKGLSNLAAKWEVRPEFDAHFMKNNVHSCGRPAQRDEKRH